MKGTNKLELVEGVIYREVDGNLLILDQQNKRYHSLNETAMEIFLLCNGKNTIDNICSELAAKYIGDNNDIINDVKNTISTLIQLELIQVRDETDLLE